MRYRYRNVKTGEIITTSNRISGKNWEPVEDTTVQPTGEEGIFEDKIPEEELAEEELAEEEVPAEKPKPTRRGKK